jgi:Phasin protein
MKRLRRSTRDGRRIQRAARAGSLATLKSARLAQAAGHVLAKRTGLGLVAMANPAQADKAEFARILPEKAEASRASAITLMQCSGDIAWQATRFASSEMAMASKAAADLARCRTPAAAIAIQSQFATAWFFRAFSQSIAVGALAMRSYSAVLSPIHRVAVRNSRRLVR